MSTRKWLVPRERRMEERTLSRSPNLEPYGWGNGMSKKSPQVGLTSRQARTRRVRRARKHDHTSYVLQEQLEYQPVGSVISMVVILIETTMLFKLVPGVLSASVT